MITENAIAQKKSFALIHGLNNTYLLYYLKTILLIQVFAVEILKKQKSFFRFTSKYLHMVKRKYKSHSADEIYQIPFLHAFGPGHILRGIL